MTPTIMHFVRNNRYVLHILYVQPYNHQHWISKGNNEIKITYATCKCLPYKCSMPTSDFFKTYQEMCRQLDAPLASSCLFTQPEIKQCPRTPTAEFPKEWSHNWPSEQGGDSTAHRHIWNKLQEVHSSTLASVTPCHATDFQ